MKTFKKMIKWFHLARSPLLSVSLSVYLPASSLCLRNAGGGVAFCLPRLSCGFQSKVTIILAQNCHTQKRTQNPVCTLKHTNTTLPFLCGYVFVYFSFCSFVSLWHNRSLFLSQHSTNTHVPPITAFPE